jgi:predicted transcriptional regulator
MIKITLIREIKGKDLIKEYEKKYGTIEKLEKLCKKHDDNPLIALDLDDWEYFKDKPDEIMKQKKILYNFEGFTPPDLNIINLIKNEKPESITELARMMDKDSGNVAKQVNKLKKEGIIEIKEGNINNKKTTVFNYDKIEIAR